MSAYKRIQRAMLGVEVEVKRYVRSRGAVDYSNMSLCWMKALDRLVSKGQARFDRNKNGYVLIKRRAA